MQTDKRYPVRYGCSRHTAELTRAEILEALGGDTTQLDATDNGTKLDAIILPASACAQCAEEYLLAEQKEFKIMGPMAEPGSPARVWLNPAHRETIRKRLGKHDGEWDIWGEGEAAQLFYAARTGVFPDFIFRGTLEEVLDQIISWQVKHVGVDFRRAHHPSNERPRLFSSQDEIPLLDGGPAIRAGTRWLEATLPPGKYVLVRQTENGLDLVELEFIEIDDIGTPAYWMAKVPASVAYVELACRSIQMTVPQTFLDLFPN